MDLNQNEENERIKINVEPGKNVGISDFPSTSVASSPPDEDNPEDETGFAVDDYFTFSYEEERFPGQITAIDEEVEMCEIRAMVKSEFNWKWPKEDGIMFYPFSDVDCKIQVPQPRKRETFAVLELADRWGSK